MIGIDLGFVTIGVVGICLLFVLLAMRMPIGFGMALIGFAGFAYIISVDAAYLKLATTCFDAASSYHFSVIPLFILMAHFCFQAGLSKDLYNFAFNWFGWLPGGLAMATIISCALFAAISASSLATVVTFALVALPEMKKYKYDVKLSAASVAAGGTMGSLIPPSSALIVYGLIAEQSIGKLFIAGVVPGILEALFYLATILIWCRINPKLGPRGPATSFKDKLSSLYKIIDVVLLTLLLLGGLFIGWFTPTEAGAIGACGALVISIIKKRINWQGFKEACWETMKATGMLYAMIIGAMVLNFFLAISTIPIELSTFVSELPISPLGIMVTIAIMYLILGCFLDAFAMMLLTVPIFLNLITSLGYDAIWFGIFVARMTEIAVITPPIGVNAYTVGGLVPGVKINTIFKGLVPFVIADFINVTLLLLFPGIVLFLPNLIM